MEEQYAVNAELASELKAEKERASVPVEHANKDGTRAPGERPIDVFLTPSLLRKSLRMRAAFQKQQDEEARARREDEMKGEQAASSKRRKRNQTRGHDLEHGDDSDDEDEDDEDAGNSEISDEDHEAELRGERASQPSKKKRKTTSSSDQDEDDNEGGKHVVQQVKGSRGCLDIVKPKNITNMDFAGNLEGLVAGWKKGDWKKTLVSGVVLYNP